MRKMFLFIILIVLPLMTHPENRNFEQDKYECDLIAAQYLANIGEKGNISLHEAEQEKCMKIKYGWRETK